MSPEVLGEWNVSRGPGRVECLPRSWESGVSPEVLGVQSVSRGPGSELCLEQFCQLRMSLRPRTVLAW